MLGAGVVGVTAAWSLRRAGLEVEVVEREPASAMGTSYANAGQISPALSSPWSYPGVVGKAIRWALAERPPLRFGRVPDAEMVRFLWRMWRASGAARYRESKLHMVRLAEYSRDRLRDLRQSVHIDYDGRQNGLLVALRDRKGLAGYAPDLAVLDELGVPYRVLERDALTEVEPNIAPASGVVAGIHLLTDESGDCRRFTQALAADCAAHGVRFHHRATVTAIEAAGGRATGVRIGAERLAADLVVVALATASNALLAPHGVRLPVYPVKGYSLTVACDADALGPRGTISDESEKVGLTNLGGRIRVGGTAELAGHDLSRPEGRYAGLLHSLRGLFPRVPEAAISRAERWAGLRPVTPDGPPLVGPCRYPNLFVNTGHGTLGWTMACGSAAALADMATGRAPEIDMTRFSPARWTA